MTEIAIVGAGPGGLTLATVLHRHGLTATVYERDADAIARAQGGPLDLHPRTGQRALREAGLNDAFVARARHAGQDMRILEPDGTVCLDQVTPDDAPLVDPEIDRGDLRALLLDAAPEVRWGRRLVAIEDRGRRLFFADGSSAHCDLLVGADGANSMIRPLLTDARPSPTGDAWVETGIAAPTAAQLDLVGRGNLWALGADRSVAAQVVGDGSLRVACSFRGDAAPGFARTAGDRQCRRVAAADDETRAGVARRADERARVADAAGGTDERARAELLEAFVGWAPPLVELLAACDLPVTARHVEVMPVGARWRPTPGVTLLGDAAHLMPPVGMGANLAMLDGAELGLALAAHPGEPDAAVAVYEAAMLDRAATASAESAEIARRLLSPTAARDMAAMLG